MIINTCWAFFQLFLCYFNELFSDAQVSLSNLIWKFHRFTRHLFQLHNCNQNSLWIEILLQIESLRGPAHEKVKSSQYFEMNQMRSYFSSKMMMNFQNRGKFRYQNLHKLKIICGFSIWWIAQFLANNLPPTRHYSRQCIKFWLILMQFR